MSGDVRRRTDSRDQFFFIYAFRYLSTYQTRVKKTFFFYSCSSREYSCFFVLRRVLCDLCLFFRARCRGVTIIVLRLISSYVFVRRGLRFVSVPNNYGVRTEQQQYNNKSYKNNILTRDDNSGTNIVFFYNNNIIVDLFFLSP